MQSDKDHINTLKDAERIVRARFSRFGVNKTREIVRLLYEISKKNGAHPGDIIPRELNDNFEKLKEFLLRERFPAAYSSNELKNPYLPKITLDPEDKVELKAGPFYPKKIFVEDAASRSYLVGRIRTAFRKAELISIPSLKDFIKADRFSIKKYNKRRDSIFIVNEKYDFFKKCPCTKLAMGCGYHIFNMGFGCIFECTYCYLQEYINTPGIILAANPEDFFRTFPKYKKRGMRIGTGEFSDSLMLDDITGYATLITDFLRGKEDVTFEFKTKSDRIDNLLNAGHSGNIVISWSFSPQNIIDKNEYYTAPLNKRLSMAKKAVQAGYKIGAHFDPVFHYTGWEKDYTRLIDRLFDHLHPKDIAWLSIGTFRFKPETKKIIEHRFPENSILDEELMIGYDRKLRYSGSVRYKIYKKLLAELFKRSRKLPVYLCMEERSMWKELNLKNPFRNC